MCADWSKGSYEKTFEALKANQEAAIRALEAGDDAAYQALAEQEARLMDELRARWRKE